MAVPNWTSAALRSDESTALAADKPMVLAPTPPPDTAVRWTTTGTQAGADKTLTGYPAARFNDGFPHLLTKPNAAAATNYINMDFGTSGLEFDAIAIMGHNFDTISLTTVQLELDDGSPPDGTFGAVESLTALTLVGSDDRVLQLFSLRYSDVRYARLKLVAAGAVTPQIGELLILRRTQLRRNPLEGFDPTRRLNDTSELATSRSGVSQKIVHYQNQFVLEASIREHLTDNVQDLVNHHERTRSHFVWCYRPTSALNSFNLMVRNPDELVMPQSGWARRDTMLSGLEQGPERFFLSKE